MPRRWTPPYTKLIGAALLFGCVSAFLSLAFGTLDVAGKAFRAGGYVGDWLAALLAEYLNRTGSIILILTLLFLAIILSTQFSFGRLFAALAQLVRDRWAAMLGARRAAARRAAARASSARRCSKKHLDKAPAQTRRTRQAPSATPKIAPERDRRAAAGATAAAGRRPRDERAGRGDEAVADRRDGRRRRRRARRPPRRKPTPPPRRSSGRAAAGRAPSLPLPEPEKVAGRAEEGRVHAAAARAARRAEGASARSTSAS